MRSRAPSKRRSTCSSRASSGRQGSRSSASGPSRPAACASSTRTWSGVGISRDDYVEQITAQELAEVRRRLRYFRGEARDEVVGRTAILVDDGLATGVTARAAVQALRLRKPGRLVLAAPVCAAQTAALFKRAVDELVCLETPSDLGAIGFWYRNFEQTSDEEVVELLERARRRTGGRREPVDASGASSPAGGRRASGRYNYGTFLGFWRGERYVRQVYAFYPGRQAGRGVPIG